MKQKARQKARLTRFDHLRAHGRQPFGRLSRMPEQGWIFLRVFQFDVYLRPPANLLDEPEHGRRKQPVTADVNVRHTRQVFPEQLFA